MDQNSCKYFCLRVGNHQTKQSISPTYQHHAGVDLTSAAQGWALTWAHAYSHREAIHGRLWTQRQTRQSPGTAQELCADITSNKMAAASTDRRGVLARKMNLANGKIVLGNFSCPAGGQKTVCVCTSQSSVIRKPRNWMICAAGHTCQESCDDVTQLTLWSLRKFR